MVCCLSLAVNSQMKCELLPEMSLALCLRDKTRQRSLVGSRPYPMELLHQAISTHFPSADSVSKSQCHVISGFQPFSTGFNHCQPLSTVFSRFQPFSSIYNHF